MRVVPDRSVPSLLADPAHFTGRVWRTEYLAPADVERMSGARFWYRPGARSGHWHVHEREQAIIGVYGTGMVAWEGLAANSGSGTGGMSSRECRIGTGQRGARRSRTWR